MLIKYCKKCETDKPVTEFYKNHRTSDGLFYQCKACCALQDKKQIQVAPFKKRIREFNRMLRNEGHTEQLTIEQFTIIYESQNSICAICKKKIDQLCIDHNHSNGKVRALLCHHCNTLLGMCYENTLILEQAIQYLQHHNTE